MLQLSSLFPFLLLSRMTWWKHCALARSGLLVLMSRHPSRSPLTTRCSLCPTAVSLQYTRATARDFLHRSGYIVLHVHIQLPVTVCIAQALYPIDSCSRLVQSLLGSQRNCHHCPPLALTLFCLRANVPSSHLTDPFPYLVQ